MFRDTLAIEPAVGFWQSSDAAVAKPRNAASVAALVEDEVGAVAHVYREIARRIANNAFTRHASTLGDALR
jgi:hypothetical protein